MKSVMCVENKVIAMFSRLPLFGFFFLLMLYLSVVLKTTINLSNTGGRFYWHHLTI